MALTQEDFKKFTQILDERLEVKLEEKLEEKLEQKLEEKLEQKFEEKLKPIYIRLDKLEARMDRLESRMDRMENYLYEHIEENRQEHANFERLLNQSFMKITELFNLEGRVSVIEKILTIRTNHL